MTVISPYSSELGSPPHSVGTLITVRSALSSPSNPLDLEAPDARRSSAVWFEAGDLVLFVRERSSDDFCIFKVFRAILSLQSIVLKDSLKPTASDIDVVSTYQGCPVLHLVDSPVDMTHFLRAVHDLSFSPRWSSLEAVEALLKLGSKYRVERLRQVAISTLSLEFPARLQDYDQRMHRRVSVIVQTEDVFRVLHLAREFNLVQLLPCILYRCAVDFSILDICNGYSSDAESNSESTVSSSATSKISNPLDIQLCLVGRETILTAHHAIPSFLRRHPTDGRSSRHHEDPSIYHCADSRRCSTARWHQVQNRLSVVQDPLRFGFDWEGYATVVCDGCFRYAQESHRAERQAFWVALPGLFGLPKWDEILDSAAQSFPG